MVDDGVGVGRGGGRKEGSKEGRKHGRKQGRKEAMKQGLAPFCSWPWCVDVRNRCCRTVWVVGNRGMV